MDATLRHALVKCAARRLRKQAADGKDAARAALLTRDALRARGKAAIKQADLSSMLHGGWDTLKGWGQQAGQWAGKQDWRSMARQAAPYAGPALVGLAGAYLGHRLGGGKADSGMLPWLGAAALGGGAAYAGHRYLTPLLQHWLTQKASPNASSLNYAPSTSTEAWMRNSTRPSAPVTGDPSDFGPKNAGDRQLLKQAALRVLVRRMQAANN